MFLYVSTKISVAAENQGGTTAEITTNSIILLLELDGSNAAGGEDGFSPLLHMKSRNLVVVVNACWETC